MKSRSDKALEQTVSPLQGTARVLQTEILTDLAIVPILAEINLHCFKAIIRVPADRGQSEILRCS